MTQPFNPFAAAPTQPAPTPARVQTPPAQRSLNDAKQGFEEPFMKHLDIEADVKIIGYVGAKTTVLGRACHISFQVLKSNTQDVVPGQTYRIAYKYDFERSEQAEKDPYGSDLDQLSSFVHALFNQRPGAGFDAKSAERSLHSHDWATQPAVLHLSGTLGKPKLIKGTQDMRRYRDDRWSPVAG